MYHSAATTDYKCNYNQAPPSLSTQFTRGAKLKFFKISDSEQVRQTASIQCENGMWNRPQLCECITSSYVLLCSVKAESTVLKHCTVRRRYPRRPDIDLRVLGEAVHWRMPFTTLNEDTICPSPCPFPPFFLLSFYFISFFCFISDPVGSRGGLNGDCVASWEQHPGAVWVCKAELQHQ